MTLTQNEIDFIEWMAKHKVRHPKCTISQAGGCRGVVAIQDIAKGEVVVQVPDKMVLMPSNSCISRFLDRDGLCSDSEDPALETIGLILAVMAEKCRKTSRWGAYLEALPHEIPGMPIFWPADELAELAGSSALEKLLGEGEGGFFIEPPTAVEARFEAAVAPFLAQHGAALGSAMPPAEARRLYLWATGVVSGYSFTLGDDKLQGMVPFWDMLNHVTGQANVRLHHSQKKGALQMIATCDVPEGAELVNCYGDLSNSELLRRYGYIEDGPSPHDCCEVPVAGVAAVCARFQARVCGACSPDWEVLPKTGLEGGANGNASCSGCSRTGLDGPAVNGARDMDPGSGSGALPGRVGGGSDPFEGSEGVSEGVPEGSGRISQDFFRVHEVVPRDGWFKIGPDGQLPAALVECLRLLLMPDGQYEVFVRQIDRWRYPLALPSMAIPGGFAEVLETLVEHRLQGFGTSLQEDERLLCLGAEGLGLNVFMAVSVRAMEKRCLLNVGSWVRANWESVLGSPQTFWQAQSVVS